MSGFVHAPGEGAGYDWRGARVTIKAAAADTHGQLAFLEFTYPAGLSVPRHFHAGEDEMFYLVEGELRGFCGDQDWVAVPGSFVFVPRDVPHGLSVVGDSAARGVVVVGPPRLDGQIAASGTPV
jgi:quercetin dioxygenase-like cupin family protein